MLNRTEHIRWVKVAWPAAFASLSFALMEIVDTAMLGLVGVDSIAGSALAGSLLYLVMSFAFNMVRAATPIAASLPGGQGPARLRALVRLTLFSSLLLGLLAIPLVLIGARILPALGIEANMVSECTTYMTWRAPVLWLEVSYVGLWAILDGLGKTKVTMAAGLISIATNVFLNCLLIPGWLGFPALGIRGAAIATNLSILIGFAVIARALLRHVMVPREQEFGCTTLVERFCGTLREHVFGIFLEASPLADEALGKRFVQIGWPMGLSGMLQMAGAMLFGLLVGRAGANATACYGIISALVVMGLSLSSGIGVASVTMIARAQGQSNTPAMIRQVRTALSYQILIGSCMTLIGWVGAAHWGGFFTDESSVVRGIFELSPLWLACLWLDGILVVLGAIQEGCGRTKNTFWATVGFDLCLLFPMVLLLPPEGGLSGFYLAWLAKDVLKALILFSYTVKDLKRLLEKAGELALGMRSGKTLLLGGEMVRVGHAGPGEQHRYWEIPVPSG